MSFFVLSECYAPNTAVTNHALCYIRGFEEMSISAKWVFLLPDGNCERVKESFRHVSVKYLWWPCFAHNRVLKHLFKVLRYYAFIKSLNRGDTVLLLGLPSCLSSLTRIKGIKVYHERTEHPLAVPRLRYPNAMKRYLNGCKRTEGLFVITRALKYYFESVGINRRKVHVINMIVDANRFQGLTKDNCEPYIAYCGNASNSKDGVDLLIRAFSIVAEKITELSLYIIGPVPSEDSENYKLVSSLGLSKRIRFTGVVPASSMPQLLFNAKVEVLARPHSLQNKYGFPTKLGEYLSTGNPVVVTSVGDIPLFLKDEESALMAEPGDIEGLASKIIWAIQNPKEAAAIGLEGKCVATRYFNYLIETQKMVSYMSINN